MTSPSELMNLPGFGADRYRKIAPYVTALPTANAQINICTAPALVLESLAANLSGEYSGNPDVLAIGRKSGCFPDITRSDQRRGPAEAAQITAAITTTSSYFRLTTRVTLGTTRNSPCTVFCGAATAARSRRCCAPLEHFKRHMPQTLLLRLPAPGQQDTEWLSIDQTGMATTAKQRGPLSLAAAVGRSAKVVVLAPATQILLAEPELPPGSGVKLARVVPFALEEQLTEDVDQLCFAIGRRGPSGRTPVAVVSRSLLQGWIAQLSGAGIEPAAIYPDISLVPHNPGQTVLWLEKARLAVRRPGHAAVCGGADSGHRGAGHCRRHSGSLRRRRQPKVPESAILYVTARGLAARAG